MRSNTKATSTLYPLPDLFEAREVTFFPVGMFVAHFLDCSWRRRWAVDPAEGVDVTCDLSDVTDVEGLKVDVRCEVVGFALGTMGAGAWGPHTFSTWRKTGKCFNQGED